MAHLFNLLLVVPIINILVAIYKILLFAHIPFAFGFSIIVLTALVRLVLYPLTASQLRSSKKMQELSPHIQRLKEKHGKDSKTIQSETMKLYKEHGVNPVAGCLPLLIQLPFIWGLYSVLNQVVHLDSHTVQAKINSMVYSSSLKISGPWDTNFFGLPLGDSPSHLIHTIGPIVILIPVLTGLLQFIQSKMLFSSAPKTPGVKKNEDFATTFQSQSAYIFPVMIAFLSWGFPIGLSLYWNTFTVFGIIQQYQIQGLGGLAPLINKYGSRK